MSLAFQSVAAQSSNQNAHVLVRLLTELRLIVRGESWWGQPLGSSQLWGKHVETIDRIDAIASSVQQQEVKFLKLNFYITLSTSF